MTPQKPEDLFRQEKERALTVRNSQHARLLAEAKAAFDKLMAEGQAARKSGRPRKHPLPPLKTTSSRPLVKPTPPAPVAKVAMPVPVKAAPVKVAAPEVRAPAKHAEPAKKVAKADSRSAPGRAASKSKPKAKRSTRR
jgi:hypothetical protein